MNAVDGHDEIRNARPCDVIRKTADGKMAAFRCRRDPCGFVCLILTYFSVFYADYVVIQYVLIPAYSERWVSYERSFKEPAFGSRNSTRDLTRSSLYKCCSLESPIATAVQEQTAFRMCFARTVYSAFKLFAASASIVVTLRLNSIHSACLLHFQSVTLWFKIKVSHEINKLSYTYRIL